MGQAIRIGRLFGIEIKLDYSWFIIFFLVASSLASSYFPKQHPGWPLLTYFALGGIASALLFGSVVAHELSHSVVSGAFGVPVRDITLFIFGGAARMTEEPHRPLHEVAIALAGPAMSLMLSGAFGLVWWLTGDHGGPLHTVTGWLAAVNLMLALFNLIPGFPLDGGRAFRALLWGMTGNLRRATRIATGVGQVVAMTFVLWGIVQIIHGQWADGLWIAFIGWFLNSAAAGSYKRLAWQQAFAGHTAREVMMTDCPTIARRLTLDALVDHVVLPSGRRCFPVVEDNQLEGLLTLHGIKAVPRSRWPATRVEDVMISIRNLKTVKADDELRTVFDRMVEENINQFPVVEEGQLLGIVARDNLMDYLSTRREIGMS